MRPRPLTRTACSHERARELETHFLYCLLPLSLFYNLYFYFLFLMGILTTIRYLEIDSIIRLSIPKRGKVKDSRQNPATSLECLLQSLQLGQRSSRAALRDRCVTVNNKTTRGKVFPKSSGNTLQCDGLDFQTVKVQDKHSNINIPFLLNFKTDLLKCSNIKNKIPPV